MNKAFVKPAAIIVAVTIIVSIAVGAIVALIASVFSQSIAVQIVSVVLATLASMVTVCIVISSVITPDLPIGALKLLFTKAPPRSYDAREFASLEINSEKLRRSVMKQLVEIPPSGAELWVVSSGKGGVGKSLISLGLAEDLSRNGKVLLLDFDLHNCGLTSLLDLGKRKSPNTAYSLLEDFRKMLETGNSADETYKSILDDDYQLPQSFDSRKHLNIILEKYAKESRLDPGKWSDLTEDSFLDPELIRVSPRTDKIRVKGEDSALIPRNAFILPSRNYKQQLLLTPVSTLSYIVVFLFLRALCYWMAVKSTIGTIILDCHGAHDAFTAASMLAAQKLVVVTTTDPGCFNGTLELLKAVEERAKLRMSTPVDTAIVFNSCHALGEQLPEVITRPLEQVQPRGIVKIAEDYNVREMTKEYEFGKISEHRELWLKIREITTLLSAETEGENRAWESLGMSAGAASTVISER